MTTKTQTGGAVFPQMTRSRELQKEMISKKFARKMASAMMAMCQGKIDQQQAQVLYDHALAEHEKECEAIRTEYPNPFDIMRIEQNEYADKQAQADHARETMDDR